MFPRAEQMLRRGAGISKLSVGPRGKLPTLMATRARVPYVSGGVAGGGRPMQAKKGGGVVGHQPAIRGVAGGGERAVGGRAVAGDVGLGRCAPCAGAVEQLRGDGRGEGQGARGVGAAVRRDVRGRARCHIYGRQGGWVAAAICRGSRAGSAAAQVPRPGILHPEGATVYATASRMAAELATRLDVLSATPSCRLLSPARRARGKKGGALHAKAEQAIQRRAQAKLLADVAAVRRLTEKCEPMVIMLEETAGLRRPRHAAGAGGAVGLAVRLAPRGERLRGVGGCAPPEAAAVGRRAARVAGGGVTAGGALGGGAQAAAVQAEVAQVLRSRQRWPRAVAAAAGCCASTSGARGHRRYRYARPRMRYSAVHTHRCSGQAPAKGVSPTG